MPFIQPITSASSGSSYVPTSRTLSINGTTYDLTADRSWTINGLSGLIATSPLVFNVGTSTLSIPAATNSVNGYLTSADWLTFSSKQPAITLTTTGNNGSATLIGATLNIPTYTLVGLGGMSNPFTTGIGQLIYSNGSGAPLSLAPNTTTTKKYLSMTGDGTNGDAPFWDTIPAGITGSGLTGQVTFWNGSNTITGNNDLFWDNTNKRLGIGDTTPAFALSIIRNENTTSGYEIQNTSTGNAANAGFVVRNAAHSGQIFKLGTGYTTYKTLVANDFGVYNAGAGDISILNDVSNGKIKFLTGTGSNPQMTLTAAGRLLIGTTSESTNILEVVGNTRLTGSLIVTTLTGVAIGNGATAMSAVSGTANQILRRNAANTAYEFFTPSFGTVTSVALTVPTGLTITGSPITTSGTLAITFTAGYSIPTTTKQSEWDTAYNRSLTAIGVSGTTTKTLTLTKQDGTTLTASWTDINTDAVTSVFGRTGAVVAASGDYNTLQVTENTNLYYTEARVNANANVAANTAARHNAVTLGTANGLSLSTQVLSLALASGSTTGALSSTDWTTFNNKQNTLTNPVTGTGTTNYIAKFTGASTVGNSIIAESSGLATIYGDGQVYKGQNGTGQTSLFITNDDNSFGNRHETKISTQALGNGLGRTVIQAASYNTSTNRGEIAILTESGANYVANIGTLITGVNNAFSLYSTSFAENIRLNTSGDSFLMGGNVGIGAINPSQKLHVNGNLLLGVTASSVGGMQFVITGTTPVASRMTFGSDGTGYSFAIAKNVSGTITDLLTINDSGTSTFLSSVTATGFVKTGGTASQILAANGSVITAGTNITISGGVISATDTIGISGSGTTNNIPKWTSGTAIGNSQIIDDGATVFINETLSPNAKLAVLQSTDSRYCGSFRTSATTGASYGLRIQAGTNSSDNTFDVFNQAGSTYFTIRGDGNIGIGTSIISSTGTSTISVRSGSAPSTNVVDSFQMYSNDITAGNAAPHFRTENGVVIKLYQETTGVGNSIFSQGGGISVLDDSTFDGYTLRQIVKALRNQGILQ